MKVLHLLSLSRWTGAAEPVFYLCRELMRRGHEIQLAYAPLFHGRRLSSRNIRRGKLSLWVESKPAPNRPTLEQKAKELGLVTRSDLRLNVYGNVLDMLSDYFTLRRILRSEQFDLVHCHLPLAFYLAALALPHSGCRLVYTHHPARMPRSDWWNRRLFQRKIHHLIVHTPEVEAFLRDTMKLPEASISLLRGGIDLTRFSAPPSGEEFRKRWNLPSSCFVIGMAARMQPKRDHVTLLRALAKLPKSGVDWRCLLIGEGEYSGELEALARELNISERIIMTGFLEHEYLQGMAAMDVFAYTAPGSDATCRAVIEAMAMAKPIIGVHSGATPLLIEPERTGLLFSPGNADELARALQSFLEQPAKAQQMGQAARRKALNELSVSQVGAEVESIYRRLVQN